MNFDLYFNFNNIFTGGIYLAFIFLAVNITFPLIIPKYNLVRFVNVPKGKNDLLYNVLFYIQILYLAVPGFSSYNYLKYSGIIIYSVGLLLYMASLFVFAISEYNKVVTKGPYRIIRHPVYFSYFIIIFGASLAISNVILLILSVYHYVLSRKRAKLEEKQCVELYGEKYEKYSEKTSSII